MWKIRIILIATIFFSSVINARSSNYDAWNNLIRARSLKCQFYLGVYGDAKDGKFKLDKAKDNFKVIFDSINLDKRHAKIIGNFGAEDVTAILTAGGLNFIEKTLTGNLNCFSSDLI